MIYITAVQAFYHELAREAEILANSKCFFIYVLCRKILCDAAIVCVRELCSVYLIIEEVVNVNIVHITLDAFEIDVLRLLLLSALTVCWLLNASVSSFHTSVVLLMLMRRYSPMKISTYASTDWVVIWLPLIVILIFRIILICLFEPVICQNLWNCESFSRIEPNHASYYLLSIFAEVYWEGKITFENELVEIF
jgi:hypothetical protein